MKSTSTKAPPEYSDTLVRSCDSCAHSEPRAYSIDDVPAICWSCVGAQGVFQFPLPYWKPKDESKSN